MDLEKLYNAIEDESSVAYGEDDSLSAERGANIDRYLGKNNIPAPDGRSQVVDRSVYETIAWMQPSLARIFANGDDVVKVQPVGPEDEAGAKQETQFLNHVIMQRNNWVQIFDTASKSALTTKAGYLYAYKKMRRQIEVERYERQTAEALALILEGEPEILSYREYADESVQPQVMAGPDGMPIPQPPPMLYDVEIRRTKEEPQFCIEVLAPERCRISKRCKTVQLTDSPYFEYHDWPTISELKQDGIEIPDDLDFASDPPNPYETEEDASRNQFSEEEEGDVGSKRVYTRWCWIRHDSDDDGVDELQYCIVAGGKVLFREEVTRIPVGVLCPDPLPFRHVGQCPADVNGDIQDIKTVIIRGGLDNLQLVNNHRTFIDDNMVNLDDLLVNRPGGIVRGKPGAIYGQHIAPIVVPPVFPQAMEAYGFMEQVNEGRTGVNRYFQGTDQNALNKTASGVQQLSSMAAQRVEYVGRMYLSGIVELAAILHELILKAGKFEERIQVNGQWVVVDPTTWRKRTDFRPTVAVAAGNKDAMMARLMQLATFQAEALKGGLRIVTERNAYETMIELTKAADLSSPERFWTDPNTVPPQQPQPDPLVEIEKMKSQTTLQGKQMDNASKEAIAQMQDQTKRMEITVSAQKELTLAQHRAETEAVFMDSKHNQSLQLEEGRGQQQAMLKRLEGGKMPEETAAEKEADKAAITEQFAQLQSGLQEMAQMMGELGRLLTARRVLERDKSGKPIGSRIEL